MDPLRLHVFEAIRNQSCGDATIDDTNLNASHYIRGILKKYDQAIDRIETNKSHFTEAGMAIHRAKAAKESLKELREVQEKSSWQVDINKVESRFDDLETESDIRVLIRESREREVRAAMKQFEGDPLLFNNAFGEQIRAGDPVICGAVVNSPLQMAVDPDIEKTAGEKSRLAQNPAAAQRLSTLSRGQEIHSELFDFATVELGIDPTDNIVDLAAGKPLTGAMKEVKIE